MTGRYLDGDSFGEYRSFEILVPFHVQAHSRTMAVRKLLNALSRAVPSLPCRDRDVCDCVADDPRVIASQWDYPDEFADFSLDDRLFIRSAPERYSQ